MAVGVNVTVNVQLVPRVTIVPQLLVCAKSTLFAPVIDVLRMLTAFGPVLVIVTVCPGLVVPTFCALNVKLVGASSMYVAVPVSATV